MTDLDILNELLEASPAVRRAMKAYLHKAFQRGQRHGERTAREKFDELLHRVHTVSHLNGATDIFKAQWEESKHPRDHGRFASAPGSSGESPAPASVNRIEHPADKHIRSLAERITDVPKRIRVKVAHLVRKRYESLVEKFGKNGARAIIAASVMMLPVPVPGATMIPIALAHAVAKIRNLVAGERLELAKAVGPEPSREELEAAAREFIEGIYQDMGEEPPEIPEELDLDGAGEPEPKKFASTQVELTGAAATKLRQLAKSIPDADLGDDGREEEPHITVRYGLHENDSSPVVKVLSSFGPVDVRIGKLNAFRGDENGKDYDVIYAEVDSPDLIRLNKALAVLPHTDTHAEYRPHATVAYVKAGLADKYLRSLGDVDESTTISAVTFSDTSRNKTVIPLDDSDAEELDLPESSSGASDEPSDSESRMSESGVIDSDAKEVHKAVQEDAAPEVVAEPVEPAVDQPILETTDQ